MTPEELFVNLASATGGAIDAARWQEILRSPPEVQEVVLLVYRDQDWSDPATPAGARLLALLGVAGAVFGVVGGGAGAANAVKTLFGK